MVKAMQALEQLAWMESVRDAKDRRQYRGVFRCRDGEIRRIATWSDFCTFVLDADCKTIDKDLQDLEAFGRPVLEALNEMGVSKRKLHTLRLATNGTDHRARLAALVKAGDTDAVAAELNDILDEQGAKHEAEARRAETDILNKDKAFAVLKGKHDKQVAALAEAHVQLNELKAPSYLPEADLDDLRMRIVGIEAAARNLTTFAYEKCRHFDQFHPLNIACQQGIVYLSEVVRHVAYEAGFALPAGVASREAPNQPDFLKFEIDRPTTKPTEHEGR